MDAWGVGEHEDTAAELAPGGRVAITTWPPRGPMFGAVAAMREALDRVRPPEGESAMVDWGNPQALEALLSPHGEVAIAEHELEHALATPEDFWDRWERLHPYLLAVLTRR